MHVKRGSSSLSMPKPNSGIVRDGGGREGALEHGSGDAAATFADGFRWCLFGGNDDAAAEGVVEEAGW